MADSVQIGADLVHGALADISAMIGELARVPDAISQEVDRQRHTASAMEESASASAMSVNAMAAEIADILDVARTTESLSEKVARASEALSIAGQSLQQAASRFVGQLVSD